MTLGLKDVCLEPLQFSRRVRLGEETQLAGRGSPRQNRSVFFPAQILSYIRFLFSVHTFNLSIGSTHQRQEPLNTPKTLICPVGILMVPVWSPPVPEPREGGGCAGFNLVIPRALFWNHSWFFVEQNAAVQGVSVLWSDIVQ